MPIELHSSSSTEPIVDPDDSCIIKVLPPRSDCHVLVVEDDGVTQQYLSVILQKAGYEVHTAGSGDEAMRVLETTRCQIVISDWQMPDMDGMALCRNLRLRTSDGYIYILMLSVRDASGDMVAGLSAGADDYVIKGATAEEILARVEVGRRITHLDRSLRTSNRENRRLSMTDPLTAVRNRRGLMKYLPRELENSQLNGQSLAILSCDLDHFKRVNDSLGHDVGDEILQQFVARARTCIRQAVDWIARTGGEEFVLVLPDTELNGGSRVAARLRAALAAGPMETSGGPVIITVSVGVTAMEALAGIGADSVEDLLVAADRCLYASKSLGRDRATAALVARASAVLAQARPRAHSKIN